MIRDHCVITKNGSNWGCHLTPVWPPHSFHTSCVCVVPDLWSVITLCSLRMATLGMSSDTSQPSLASLSLTISHHVCVYTHTWTYTYMYLCMYACVHTCQCSYYVLSYAHLVVYIHLHIYMFPPIMSVSPHLCVCICVSWSLCLYVCVILPIYVSIHTPTSIYAP